MDVNVVLLTGTLTTDPRIQTVGAKKTSLCSVVLAVKRYVKSGSEKKGQDTDFFKIDAWGTTADYLGKHAAKGRRLFVNGNFHINKVGKEYYTSVTANEVRFIDAKPAAAPKPGEEPEPPQEIEEEIDTGAPTEDPF